MGKKIFLFLLMIVLMVPLFSIDLALDLAIGHRNSSYFYSPIYFSAKGEIENFDLFFQSDMGEAYDIVLSYDIKQGSTINHNINASTQLVPDLGGFQTLSYIFSQKFRWDFFSLKYAIGAQFGLAWSPDSVRLAYSISPMGALILGFDVLFFSSDIFLTTYLDEERSWKATPVIGARLDFDITNNIFLYTLAYFEIAELFMQPYLVLSSYGGKVGFIIRGDV